MRISAYLFFLLLISVSCDIQSSPKNTDTSTLRKYTQPTGTIQIPFSYAYSHHAHIRDRDTMQDTHIIYTTDKYMIAAVFDGHGGSTVSGWLQEHFPQRLIQALEDLGEGATIDDQKNAIEKCYQNLDKELFDELKKENDSSGSTAVVYLAIKYPNQQAHEMLINLGDSRAIWIKKEQVQESTYDHKPDNREEFDRIMNNKERTGAIKGVIRARNYVLARDREYDRYLAVSRAFGDYHFKTDRNASYYSGCISAEPDIYEINTKPDDYIVLASDGLWDYMNSEEVATFIAQNPPQNIAEALAQRAQSIGKARQRFAQQMGWRQHRQDNISIIVLRRETEK